MVTLTSNLTNNGNGKIVLDVLSVQELVDLAVEPQTQTDNSINELRSELINRGKNDIAARINIKKSCKKTISRFESLLNTISNENNSNKEVIKTFKNRFLTSVSILDKIQLEWQKYDLGILDQINN